jgi:hypothetical protein
MEIGLSDVTPELARRSGFKGVVDLLKMAKHEGRAGVLHRVSLRRVDS